MSIANAELDDLLEELRELKLDLPVSRGTDVNDRKLGALGTPTLGGHRAAASRPGPVDTGASSLRGSRPTTAQFLEDIERQGLETVSPGPPAELDRSASLELLEESVLREMGSPVKTPEGKTVERANRTGNSVDALMMELEVNDGESPARHLQESSEAQKQTGSQRSDAQTSRGCRIV